MTSFRSIPRLGRKAARHSRWRTAARLFGVGCFAAAAGCVFPGPSADAQNPPPPGGPSPVDSFIVVDYHSRKILNARQPSVQRPVASLTKIATALVVLDWAELTGTDLGVMAAVPPSALQIGGANPLGMMPGDGISLRDALYAALMGSDNVAAETLAGFVGADLLRRKGEGGNPVQHFVVQMNALAAKEGMENTKFTNPHGMDHVKPAPYSTAADMARLSIEAVSRPAFRFYTSQTERKITYQRHGESQSFLVKNTNKLVVEDGVDGIKTGLTTRAGPCLALTATKQPIVETLPSGQKMITPRRLIVVVLGAPNRFEVSAALLEQGWRQFQGWFEAGRPVQSADELLGPLSPSGAAAASR